MAEIPSCPYCQIKIGFVIELAASGTVREFFYNNGQYAGRDDDSLRLQLPTTVMIRCAACKKVRTDILLDRDNYEISVAT